MPIDVQDFDADVLDRSHRVPVVVDFWASWCGPCQVLGQVLERLATEAQDRWVLAKVNTELHPELARRYEIRSVPNVKLFHQGKVLTEFVGALPAGEVRKWLGEALPSPHASSIERARGLVGQRAWAEAHAALDPILAAEPGNLDARLLLAECCLHEAPGRVVGLLAGLGPDFEQANRVEALRTLARLVERANRRETLASGGGRDHFLAGAEAVRRGDYSAALESLIEVLRSHREYEHELVRAACKSVFLLLGVRHPISERFYRAFSSTLYA